MATTSQATSYIAFNSTRGGNYDIWLYNVRTGRSIQLTNGLGDSFSIPVWSADNSKIAFVGRNGIVYIIYLAIGGIAAIDQIETDESTTLDWSPTNRDLAYTTRNQIYLYDVQSHKFRVISEQGGDVQWFPSGREILYQGADEAGVQQLYRIGVNGSGKRQITSNNEGPLNNVRLSPDGTFALYTTPGASISLIRTVELSTGALFEIDGGSLAKNYHPTWSPNSGRIVFSATSYSDQQGYYNEIRVVGKRGGQEKVLTTSSCFSTPVTWSPDGRAIAFLSGCKEQEFAKEMWAVTLQNPRPILLLREPQLFSLMWSSPRNRLSRKIYTNQTYKVSFYYPAHWQRIEEERYEGFDGFFQISAISGGENIEEICRNEAFHKLMPYGTNPRIQRTFIQNQEACYIFPSADQPPEMNRQAALIVRYPVPVQIGGATYQYFVLWADESHIGELVRRIKLL
ncbi:TolB family protein [Fredinandcohnia sp. 179-A 10B2 NHS]